MENNALNGKIREERGVFFFARKLGDGLERMIEIPVFILSIIMTVTVLLGVFFQVCREVSARMDRGIIPLRDDMDGPAVGSSLHLEA